MANKLFAASIVTAASFIGTETQAQVVPPSVPPSINRRSDKDLIPVLMLKLYDLKRDEFNKTLGMGNVHPVEPTHYPNMREIYHEITDRADLEKCSSECGVDSKGVRKIIIKGDDTEQKYFFMGDSDKVLATSVTIKFADDKSSDALKSNERVRSTFTTTHIPGDNNPKIIFGYKELKSSDTKPSKLNMIEASYDAERKTISTTCKRINAPEGKPIGTYKVADIIEQHKKLQESELGTGKYSDVPIR